MRPHFYRMKLISGGFSLLGPYHRRVLHGSSYWWNSGKKYVGHIYLSNMRREFHNLKQRQMSVTEYQREFIRLSKYAPKMLVTEEEKCHKFEDDLNDHIRAHVTGFFHDDFSKIVTCALNVERVKKEEYERKERRQGKKNPGQSSSY